MNDESNRYGRKGRFVLCCMLFVQIFYWTISTTLKMNNSVLYALVILCVYLTASSILTTAISVRLYRQHKLGQAKFDVGSIILFVTLITLPFAAANATWEIFDLAFDNDLNRDKIFVLLYMTGGFAFLWLPLFYVTEAILHWGTNFVLK